MPAAPRLPSPGARARRARRAWLLLAAAAACSRQPAPTPSPTAQAAPDSVAAPPAATPSAAMPSADTRVVAAPIASAGATPAGTVPPPARRDSAAGAIAARYELAPTAALTPAVVAGERALAAPRASASSRGRAAAPAPVAPPVDEMASIAARSLVPLLALVAGIDVGAASDSSAPVAAAASQAVKKASVAQRSGAWLQKGLAWTSIGLGLAGAGVAIAGGDASTTAALALAGTVTSSLTALMSIRKPSGATTMASTTAEAPLESAPRAPGDTSPVAGTTRLDSATQALAGEAFAARLALDVRVGAQAFAALRDEAAALADAGREAGATADYASLAPRATAALDVEVPRLLGLARAGAESPLVPATRRPALLDAVARLDAVQRAWRRDRALHARAERVAMQAVATP